MIPVGLRVRPQFDDLLQKIAKHPYIPRYPNRDAKRLRNGFVSSRFDEDNLILADQQQLNVVNFQARHQLILQTAMEAGAHPSSLDLSTLPPLHPPILAEVGGMTEQQRLQELADRVEEQRQQDYQIEQKRLKAIGLVQSVFRGSRARGSFPEITPDMGPQMPDFLAAAAPNSDVILV